jgi:hypothetical protein
MTLYSLGRTGQRRLDRATPYAFTRSRTLTSATTRTPRDAPLLTRTHSSALLHIRTELAAPMPIRTDAAHSVLAYTDAFIPVRADRGTPASVHALAPSERSMFLSPQPATRS